MYKCPHCGGEMEFLPENGIIKCEYCGSEFSPEESGRDFQKTRKTAEEHPMGDGKVYTCSQCGANLYTTEETGVTFCSYCGSQAFLESQMMGSENIAPDMIIPFQISKERCQKIYRDKIKRAWFLPSKMKEDTQVDKFRGIYMPCWVYSGESDAEGEYTGVTTTHLGRYDIIKTYQVNAAGHGVYDGYVRDASSSFPDGIMNEIAPFSIKKAVPFHDSYMTGFYADIGNVPSEVYEKDIYHALDSNVKKSLRKNRSIINKSVSSAEIERNTNVQSRITNVRKGFLPVWFLSNKHERTGMMSYAVINGLTGKIHADLPVDMKKYLLLSLAIAVPVFLVLLLIQELLAQNFSFKPKTILVITMLLLGVLLTISTKMLRDAYIQEHGLDDAGLRYLKKKESGQKEPEPMPESVRTSKRVASHGNSKGAKGARIVLFGILCFLILPIVGAAVGNLLGLNLAGWGFAVGIFLFIMTVSSGKSSSSDDKEIRSGQKIKLPFAVVMRAMALPLVGILVAIVILILSPAHDLYYYGAVVLCCAMLILTVLDFVRSTARLALRKPAQLGKRGGDEDA